MAKIATAYGRSVEEWIGKTPDSKPPAYVIQRIAERAGWRCHISGTVIDQIKHKYGRDWQAEHVIPLEAGGENRESNLAPALIKWHAIKTAAENKARGKRNRGIRKRTGISETKNPVPGSRASGLKHHMDGKWTCRKTGRVLKEPRP